MKRKHWLLFLLGFVLTGMVVNACKKNNETTVPLLFTRGKWQLASVVVTITKGSTTVLDTLNTTCDSTQLFTFNTNNTCTYTNFDCKPQVSNGSWSLSQDQLTLVADMTCKDTTAVGTSKPFINAQIVNMGQYSMVLQTGDYNVIPTSTNSTRTVRWGFVRQKTIN